MNIFKRFFNFVRESHEQENRFIDDENKKFSHKLAVVMFWLCVLYTVFNFLVNGFSSAFIYDQFIAFTSASFIVLILNFISTYFDNKKRAWLQLTIKYTVFWPVLPPVLIYDYLKEAIKDVRSSKIERGDEPLLKWIFDPEPEEYTWDNQQSTAVNVCPALHLRLWPS